MKGEDHNIFKICQSSMKLNLLTLKRIASILSLSFLLLLTGFNVNAQVQTARYISMNANTKGFYEYLPEGYNASGTQTYPLILFIHGMGELGDGSAAKLPLVLRNAIPKLISQSKFPTSFTVNGQTFRFVIISPQFVDSVSTSINYFVLLIVSIVSPFIE